MTTDPVILGILLYVGLTMAVGIYAGKRVGGSEDFIVAGRRLGLWLATGTLSATWFGGGIVIGAASQAYRRGFPGVIADPFGAALCLFVAGFLYVRMMRRLGVTTVASFFEMRFGPEAGLIASICTIPAYVGWVASLMVAFGRLIQALVGIDPVLGICLAAGIVLIYTTAGGMWAVTLTDFIQVGVLIVGLLIIAPMLIHDMGGWTAIRSQLSDEMFHLYPRESAFAAWFGYTRDWLVIGFGNLAGQDLMQRALSSRDERVAQYSAYLSGGIYLTVGLIPVFLGIAGTIIFPNLADPDLIMMKLGMKYLSPLALALFMGALVSALMSSADSALLAPASVIGWNIGRSRYKGLLLWTPVAGLFLALGVTLAGWWGGVLGVAIATRATYRQVKKLANLELSQTAILRLCRGSVVLLGILSLYMALSKQTVYSLMVDSWSILLATLFVPLTAGIWWPRANRLGGLASMIAGFLAWICFLLLTPDLPGDLLAVPISLLALVLTSLLSAKSCPPEPLRMESGEVVPYSNRLGTMGPRKDLPKR